MFCEIDMQNIPMDIAGMFKNIMWSIVSPTKHCYGYEYCYEKVIE